MSEEKTSETSPKKGWLVFVLTVVIVLFVWGVNWLFAWNVFDKNDERNAFGGMFGAASALFSGLAFAALIYTIWLQREELKLQRDELKLQREALQLQASELKRQADELSKTVSIQETLLELEKKQFEYSQGLEARNQERLTKACFVQSGNIIERYYDQAEIIVKLRNTGALASSLKVTSDRGLVSPGVQQVDSAQEITLVWRFEKNDLPDHFNVILTYIDSLGNKQIQTLIIQGDKSIKDLDDKWKVVSKTK